ncbi:MAG TPA: threonine-phosphate decarboxylase [Candidatus Spyradocola merdavium]|nr:threonine-phosphate decarboxylase [Candidatus Spyradocola merdavium]
MCALHGGDWAGYLAEFGAMPLDFSANTSPLGLPPGVRRAAEAALEAVDRYPDPACRELRRALAAHHAVRPAQVLCGAGAADLIYRLALAVRPRRALLPAPTFAEYGRALALAGCAVERAALREGAGFVLQEDFLARIVPGVDLVFLCEPNNPTGLLTPRPLLRRILARCEECGAMLAVDECFHDFLAPEAQQSLIPLLADHPRLVVLRAFTKFYAMAGLRLGYALCGDEALAARMAECGPPWAVSSPAQAAGLAALRETDYACRLRRLIGEERPRLAAQLRALACRVLPGQANYLLFFHPDEALVPKLRETGVLLRDCRNFVGLSPGWYRAAVRTRPENEIFLQKLKEVL